YSEVEAQQLTVAQHRPEQRRHRLGVAMYADAPRIRHDEFGDDDTDQRQRHHEPEDTRHADQARGNRPRDHRDHEGRADGEPDQGHGLGAVLLGGQIGDQRQDHRADGAGTLQGAADDDTADRAGERGYRAAGRKQEKPEHDHDLAAEAIGEEPERNLQQALGQAVNAEGFADQI